MRRIVITAIVLVGAGLTASSALATSSHFRKGRERSCVITVPAISKSVSCRRVVGTSANTADNNTEGTSLPYDEFGLGANQPNQPRVGSDGTLTRRDVAGSTAPTSTADNSNDISSGDGNTLPYDEFGLSANRPSQPRVGGDGTQTRRG